MAESYLQFSEVLAPLSDAEANWLRQQLEPVYIFGDRTFGEDDLPADLSPEKADRICVRALRDFDTDEELGFEYQFRSDPALGQHLWLYADEWGSPFVVAHLVQMFLRQFRPDTYWSLTYSASCSKPRVSEFGGGAMFVTAESIESFEVGEFVEQRRAAFQARPKLSH